MEMYANKMYLSPFDILAISLRCLKDGLSHFFKSLKTAGQGEAEPWGWGCPEIQHPVPKKTRQPPRARAQEGRGRAAGAGKNISEFCRGMGKRRQQLWVPSAHPGPLISKGCRPVSLPTSQRRLCSAGGEALEEQMRTRLCANPGEDSPSASESARGILVGQR